MQNLVLSYSRAALALACSGWLLASCESKNADATPTAPTAVAGNNVFIINEGAYGKASASVTFLDKATKALTADIFQAANSRALGDVAQSLAVRGNTGYVVVNNSNKIEVVSLPGFKATATIGGLAQPRYLAYTTDGQGYVTEWVSPTKGQVSVIDLATNTLLGSLPTGRNPEQLLYANNTIYVPNSDENTLTIIDPVQQKVTGTIPVGDGPTSVVADANGFLWVLCEGITRYGGAPDYAVLSSTPGALIRISPRVLTQQVVYPFAAGSTPHHLRLSPSGTQLYYTVGAAEYRMETSASSLPTTPLIRRPNSSYTALYGFDIDPQDNTLYVLDASFTGSSKLVRYRATGTAIDSFATGIGSNGAAFY